MNLDESTLRPTGRLYLFTSHIGDCYNGLCNRRRWFDYLSPVSNESRERLHRALSRREEIWIPCAAHEPNVQQADFADDKKSLAAVDIQPRLRHAAYWQRRFSMADDPQSSAVRSVRAVESAPFREHHNVAS